MQNIEISVSEEIFDIFPAYRRAVVVGRDVNNNALPDVALSKLLSAEHNRILKDSKIDVTNFAKVLRDNGDTSAVWDAKRANGIGADADNFYW